MGMHYVVYVKAAINGTLHSIQQKTFPYQKPAHYQCFIGFARYKFQNIVRQMEAISYN